MSKSNQSVHGFWIHTVTNDLILLFPMDFTYKWQLVCTNCIFFPYRYDLTCEDHHSWMDHFVVLHFTKRRMYELNWRCNKNICVAGNLYITAFFCLLRLSITCGIWNSNHHQQLRFSLPENYKNNKMDRNPPIIAKNVTFWPRVNEPWKTEAFKMDRNPPITAKNMTLWPRWTHFIRFQRLSLRWLMAGKTQPLVVI